MTPNEQAMWRDIAETIEPYCVNGGGFIRDFYEDEKCIGFEIDSMTSRIRITALGIGLSTNQLIEVTPGTFEGCPILETYI